MKRMKDSKKRKFGEKHSRVNGRAVWRLPRCAEVVRKRVACMPEVIFSYRFANLGSLSTQVILPYLLHFLDNAAILPNLELYIPLPTAINIAVDFCA